MARQPSIPTLSERETRVLRRLKSGVHSVHPYPLAVAALASRGLVTVTVALTDKGQIAAAMLDQRKARTDG